MTLIRIGLLYPSIHNSLIANKLIEVKLGQHMKNPMLPAKYSYDLTVNSCGKAFAHVRNCLLMKKAHGTNRIVEEQTHLLILCENDTKKRIHQALCKNNKRFPT
jgi:hypothetical protein